MSQSSKLTPIAGVQAGRAQATLAVADQDSPTLHTYDVRSGSDTPLETFSVHRAPVVAMRYVPRHNTIVSLDAKGAQAQQLHTVLLRAQQRVQVSAHFTPSG